MPLSFSSSSPDRAAARLARRAEIWLLACDPAPQAGLASRWQPLLSEDERARAERLRRPADRERAVLAWGLLRCTLSRYRARPPESWRFHRDEHGRPWICDDQERGLYFGLSHCGGMVAVIVSDQPRCGVDVERADAVRDPLVVARALFSPGERALLEAAEPAERRRLFTERWCLREAWSKACGRGLELPVERVAFTVEPRGVQVAMPAELGRAEAWRFALWRPSAGHVLAAALGCGDREIVLASTG